MNRESLQEVLERFTAPMALVRPEGERKVRCLACADRCLIPEGRAGVCRVRFNRAGTLYGPWGYVSALQNDPVEKKPFYHVYPGARALSFGMLGCSFHCGYCQNWLTSQTLRDPAAVAPLYTVSADELVRSARREDALLLAGTYNEPLITTEWAVAVFRRSKAEGFANAYVSNGYNTPEAIEYLRPYLDLCNVDLKSFRDRRYRTLGATLQGVLEGIERVHRAGMWMELITLVVPGFNDSDGELRDMAAWIAALSPDIPWHVTAFHPSYRMSDVPPTPLRTLRRAYEIGKAAGLHYVYPGNLPGFAGLENTTCPHCGTLLVERRGVSARSYHLADGHCPGCGAAIAGRWHTAATASRARFGEESYARAVWA